MKRVDVNELIERIDEILRLVVEEGEAFDITEQGKVIARLMPASEPKQTVEKSDAAAWAKLKRIAAELEPYWPEGVSAVDAVRDVRRDL